MKPSDVLDAAADLIEEKGHAKGVLHDRLTGAYCAIGALHWEDSLHVSAAATLSRSGGRAFDLLWDRVGNIAHWNNHPDRTADEVIETLRKVAAEARWTEDDA